MGKTLTKKSFLLFFIVLSFLAIGKTGHAKAGLLPIPDNYFFQEHSSDCEYIPRTYIANGINGSVHAWKSPESHTVITTYPNDTRFNILYLYTDHNNEVWGIFYFVEQNPAYGWLLLSDLQVEYDRMSFCQEHKNEFKEYNGALDSYEVQTSSPIIIWSYPGSGKIDGQIKEFDQYHSIVFTFMDDNDYLWGYYAYTSSLGTWRTYWGYSASWICISDPTNKKLPVKNSIQPTTIPAANDMKSISKSSTSKILAIILIISIIISILVIFLFLLFIHRKK